MSDTNAHGFEPESKKRDEDSEDGIEFSPFWGIEKGAVLQETRCFNDSQLDARRCQQVVLFVILFWSQRFNTSLPNNLSNGPQVITKLLFLCNQGDSFTKTEATEVFFAVTKLFQSKDSNLRRMVYLIIKEICPSSDEVIIVTSSLMKDMNSRIDLYRSNAIRVLCNITDAGLLGQIERYLKQAVVDKSAAVSSAALVSGMHLLEVSAETVRRWSSEVQEVANSKSPVVQFHALALLHRIRKVDKLAISKLVSHLTRNVIRSPLAQCLVIRYVAQVIQDRSSDEEVGDRPFYGFLESCLRHNSEVVIFEAARTITELNCVTTRELQPAITVLNLLLSSSKPSIRFAAIRAINRIAKVHSSSVASCNIDMEGLISDQNRSIGTLAITTLLKTGNESSIERLLKQITSFMADIQDEFKILVVEAIRSLCIKFPKKHRVLMSFLSTILREEGSFEYKKSIVESIIFLIKDIPEAKESGLSYLSEFIEDCEFTYLSSQILYLLGEQGPSTDDPSKYIRYIYNRVILENATIRASAVCSLSKFGHKCPSLAPRIITLLRRCMYDNDDEVRDRATFSVTSLSDFARGSLAEEDRYCSLATLQASLQDYLLKPQNSGFDFGAVSDPAEFGMQIAKATHSEDCSQPRPDSRSRKDSEESQRSVTQIVQFSQLGPIFKSCKAVELTEAETEYKVSCTKHVFEDQIVFQFKCTNTIKDQILEDILVSMDDIEGAGILQKMSTVHLDSLFFGKHGYTYVAFSFPLIMRRSSKFGCVLRFITKEIDPSNGRPEEDGYEDEYTLEDIDISPGDFIREMPISNFRTAWDALPQENEVVDDYSLGSGKNLEETSEALINIFGIFPCEGTEAVPHSARSHTVLLSGVYVGGISVLIRLSLGIDSDNNVAMKVTARSTDISVSKMIHLLISEA